MLTRLKNKIREYMLDNSGFSLIEVIIASAISSVILMMIYSAHRSITFGINELTGIADFYENVNLAIWRMDKDISCAYYNKNNKKLCFIGEGGSDTSGEGKMNFVSIDHRAFSILGNPKVEYPISDVGEVGYFLEPDQEAPGVFFLMRRDENHYDDEPEEGGENNILLENVVDVSFEFRRSSKWKDQWDSRDIKSLPRAVRTTLKVRNYRGNEEEFVFVSVLNLNRRNKF